MRTPIEPHAIRLSADTVERARHRVLSSANIIYTSGEKASILGQSFIHLRRLHGEIRNLLLDLQFLGKQNNNLTPIVFLVPHTNLFEGFIDPQREIGNFLFSPSFRLEHDDRDRQHIRTRFQLGDVFKIWGGDSSHVPKSNRFRNVLLDVSVEELQDILTIARQSVRKETASTFRAVSEVGAVHSLDAIQTLARLTDNLESIASGVWRPQNLDIVELQKEIDSAAQVIDRKLSVTLGNMLTTALAAQRRRDGLKFIFDNGEMYGLNSCPDLADEARRFYARIVNDRSFKYEFETLVGQLRAVIGCLNDASFPGARKKQASQILRDARLLATIHVVNLVLERQPDSRNQVVQLVTNASRLDTVVNAFPDRSLRAPVRHPRLLAWLLDDEVLSRGLDRPLAVAESLLDSFVSEVEGGAQLSNAMITDLCTRLAPSWQAVGENLVLASRSLVMGANPGAPNMDRRMSRALERVGRAAAVDVTSEDRRFAFARLDVMSVSVARNELFEPKSSAAGRRKSLEPLAVARAAGDSNALVIIPVSGQLPYAVRLPSAAGKLLTSGMARYGDGNWAVSIGQVRLALDPASDGPAGRMGSLAEIMANRLTFVLAALEASNWTMAHAICGYAIEQFDRASTELQTAHAFEILQDLIFARHLASRGLAALSRSNLNPQTIYLLDAREDLRRLMVANPDDVSTRLAQISLESEAIVLKAALDQDINNHPRFSDWVLGIKFADTMKSLQILADKLESCINNDVTPCQYEEFALFRTLEYLIFTHLLTWTEQAETVLTRELRDSILNNIDWSSILNKFQFRLKRMDVWRQTLAGPRMVAESPTAFPFAQFLQIYGCLVIEDNFRPVSGDNVKTSLGQAQKFFDLFGQLSVFCNELSENGFSRRIARKAKMKIIEMARDTIERRLTSALDALLPESERSWLDYRRSAALET